MSTVYVLTGVIGSGKTTWAKGKVDSNTFIVCKDDIREMLYGRYNYTTGDEGLIDNVAKSVVKQLVREGANVVLDFGWETLTRGGRIRLFTWLKSIWVDEIKQVFFAAIEGGVERRLQDNHGNIDRHGWEWVHNAMVVNLEIPDRDDFEEHITEWVNITEGERK